jgi:hypothetical protein
MTRFVALIGLGLAACGGPEPQTPAASEPPPPAVAPLEVEQVGYVDPLEAARADAQARAKADDSWREGFDNRAPEAGAGADQGGGGRGDSSDAGSPEPSPVAVEDPDPRKPTNLAAPTSFSEPLPTIDGIQPTPGAPSHAPDAQPPVPER